MERERIPNNSQLSREVIESSNRVYQLLVEKYQVKRSPEEARADGLAWLMSSISANTIVYFNSGLDLHEREIVGQRLVEQSEVLGEIINGDYGDTVTHPVCGR